MHGTYRPGSACVMLGLVLFLLTILGCFDFQLQKINMCTVKLAIQPRHAGPFNQKENVRNNYFLLRQPRQLRRNQLAMTLPDQNNDTELTLKDVVKRI